MEVVFFAAMLVLAPLILLVAVAFLVHRQNQRVLAAQADRALQAMLQAGDFLEGLGQQSSLPEQVRGRAADLARDYPKGDQLHVFAKRLLADLRRGPGG